MNTNNQEIVNVPVPIHLLPSVYEVLAKGMTPGRGPGQAVAPARPNEMASPRMFNAEEIRLLKNHLPKGNPRRVVLDKLAQNPESWIGYDEMLEATGISDAQLRGQLSAFTSLLTRLFRNNEWPMRWVRGVGGKNQIYYWMEKDIAEFWNAA